MIEQWWESQGDYTVLGWVIVFAYALAVVLCGWIALKPPRNMPGVDRDNHRLFWFIAAAVMLVLGVNKQLDLQLLLWLAGRSWIQSNELNEYRALIQIGSMLFMTAVAGTGLAFFIWLSRETFQRRRVVIMGVVLTAFFVFIRAISLHGLDSMLGMSLAGFTLSAVLELTGVSVVICGTIGPMRLTFHPSEP